MNKKGPLRGLGCFDVLKANSLPVEVLAVIVAEVVAIAHRTWVKVQNLCALVAAKHRLNMDHGGLLEPT